MILFHSDKSEWPRDNGVQPHRERVGKPPGNRRGSLLAEVGISTVVLMIVMGLTVKVLGTIAHERRAASERQQGALEAGNLMERITAYPFDQVTPELARRMAVSDLTRRSLRDCELAIEVSSGDQSAAGRQSAKRVMIRLRWKGAGGQWQAPVRLTSWIEPGRARP
jgi:hypothetical protein